MYSMRALSAVQWPVQIVRKHLSYMRHQTIEALNARQSLAVIYTFSMAHSRKHLKAPATPATLIVQRVREKIDEDYSNECQSNSGIQLTVTQHHEHA